MFINKVEELYLIWIDARMVFKDKNKTCFDILNGRSYELNYIILE
jgi:hypothetical protein